MARGLPIVGEWRDLHNLWLVYLSRDWLNEEDRDEKAKMGIGRVHLTERFSGSLGDPFVHSIPVLPSEPRPGTTFRSWNEVAAPWELRDREPEHPLVQAFETVITTVSVTAAYEFFARVRGGASCSSSAVAVIEPF
jgi:hypothetical protein